MPADGEAAAGLVALLADHWPDHRITVKVGDLAPVIGAALIACGQVKVVDVRKVTDAVIAILRDVANTIDGGDPVADSAGTTPGDAATHERGTP